MQNEYANRRNMHLTVLKLLDTYAAAWAASRIVRDLGSDSPAEPQPISPTA
jgi:hypothetical protein